MGGLFAVLAGLLVARLRLRAYAAGFYAGAAICLLFAFVFALVAIRHWIAIAWNLQYPDLWIAIAFVVIALPFLVAALAFQRRKPKGNAAADMLILAGPPALRIAGRKLRPRHIAVAAILIAGIGLGRRLMSSAQD